MSETLRIMDIIKGPLCVASEDGQLVYDAIFLPLQRGETIELSFQGIEIIISAFLNTAIGQLYDGSIPEANIKRQLKISGLNPNDLALLERVVENAKRYFANRAGYDHAWKEVVENGK